MKIEIFGAAGTGKTTLAKAVAKKLNWAYMEAEDYLWENTDPPFQLQYPVEERLTSIAFDFHARENIIMVGCLAGWGEKWASAFDLVVFLYVPPEIRMKRLLEREKEFYGDGFLKNKIIQKTHAEFMEWAKTYDDEIDPKSELNKHKNWVKKLNCPVLEIEGDISHEKRMELILEKINFLK